MSDTQLWIDAWKELGIRSQFPGSTSIDLVGTSLCRKLELPKLLVGARELDTSVVPA
jgi:hypothetical protein